MTFQAKNIIVAVDVDPTADRSLADRLVDDAVAVAQVHGGALTLLFVAAPVIAPLPPIDLSGGTAYRAMLDVVEARNVASGRMLKELAQRATTAGVSTRQLIATRAGSVPQVIVEMAGTEKADLILITTHARRGLSRFLLGSVAERVAHLSRIPVLLLPPAP